MNIFYLDHSPRLAAAYHCDKHVVKMILETAQLLSTAHWELGTIDCSQLYKRTHTNHPCAKWVRLSSGNYNWTLMLLSHLLGEYTHRYGKEHKTTRLLTLLCEHPPELPRGPRTLPAMVVSDDCLGNDAVTAYRRYYKLHKADIAKWKLGAPGWYINER